MNNELCRLLNEAVENHNDYAEHHSVCDREPNLYAGKNVECIETI